MDKHLGRPREIREIVSAIETSEAVSYILDPELRFAYCNPAWDKFAAENGAPELRADAVEGTELFDCIPGELKPFYSKALRDVLRSGDVWEHIYQCSSPEKFRQFRMRVHPFSEEWLMVTNPLVVEKAHEHISRESRDAYMTPEGMIVMCAHCRCSRRADNPDRWDFVPAHLGLKPMVALVSHGLCPSCRVYFYPKTAGGSLQTV